MAADATADLEVLGYPPSAASAVSGFTAAARLWVRQALGAPTAAQRLAWPALVAGKHLLVAAPTGSGKTLAAFLPVLDALLARPAASSVRCLYVAPLKALVNDARKNLQAHWNGLRALLPAGGPAVRIVARTGDSSARTRRDLRQQPPDLLLTTPESLAVLLSQPYAAEFFAGLRWVVVDELHALAPNKRGADLALSLERLTALAGEALQRVGLSATAAPLAEAARYLVGAGRRCAVARVEEMTPLEVAVEPLDDGAGFLGQLTARLQAELTANPTTLIFTNTRALAERLTWSLRQRLPGWTDRVAVHHSSLAAARRRAVERDLKAGKLRAVVTSTSLELGIDIGSVDSVVLVHPPGSVVRLLQRIGRAGHAPGRPRRGLVLTAHAADLLTATVTVAASRSGQCELLQVPACPLDVLCQHLLGMAAQGPWQTEEAYAVVRRAYPYRDLPRTDFDDCLHYLSGRRRDGTAWLPARLRWFGDQFTLTDERTARLVRRNLGTILAEPPRSVCLGESDPGGLRPGPRAVRLPLGQLDEPYADRLEPGARFLLDGRCLEYRRSDKGALLVEEVSGRPRVPRWGSDALPLSPELARRLYHLRARGVEALRDGPAALADLLRRDYGLHGTAVEMLVAYFERQECVSEVPEDGACLVEVVADPPAAAHYVHTPLNRSGNEALARVAVHRLARDLGRAADSLVADLGFGLFVGGDVLTAEDFRLLLRVEDFETDLDAALTGGPTLRERFRQTAYRGLMLLRNPLGPKRRVGGRDWVERRLFDQVQAADPDCVLLRQAWREVRSECCDGSAARAFAEQLRRLPLRCRRLAQVSPFAQAWVQAVAGPAEAVETAAEVLRRLHAALTGGPAEHARASGLAAHG